MVNEKKVLEMVKANRRNKQKGASMIEYALVVAAIVAIAGVVLQTSGDGTLGGAISAKMTSVSNTISGSGS